MTDRLHLDEEALAELKEVMEDEFGILIETYLSDSADRISALQQALDAGNDESFAKSAHSFKGSSVNIGAPQLGALCLEAELAGRAGRLDEAGVMLERIVLEFQTVRALFQQLLNP
ncbi:Hpt domain-containing protein [Marinobacter mobilis]|uniref:Hpt domain-containing protein n=1 Tax=Marinobacter mobilis TaxID=488533 RepID=A0A1H2YTN7_9GAMM|nr:Hpt domain-containing protein [Marinobacter mobilis]SDX08421.1 Hpt domain-containing protein [Marinobacter mobilis]